MSSSCTLRSKKPSLYIETNFIREIDRPKDLDLINDLESKKHGEHLLNLAREPEFDRIPLRERSTQILARVSYSEREIADPRQTHFAAAAAEGTKGHEYSKSTDRIRDRIRVIKKFKCSGKDSQSSLSKRAIDSFRPTPKACKQQAQAMVIARPLLSGRKRFKESNRVQKIRSCQPKNINVCVSMRSSVAKPKGSLNPTRLKIDPKLVRSDRKVRSMSNTKNKVKSQKTKTTVSRSSKFKDSLKIPQLKDTSMTMTRSQREIPIERASCKIALHSLCNLFRKRKTFVQQPSFTSRKHSKPLVSFDVQESRSKASKPETFFIKNPNSLHPSAKSTARVRHPLYAKSDILEELKELKRRSAKKSQRSRKGDSNDPFKLDKHHIFSSLVNDQMSNIGRTSSLLMNSLSHRKKVSADKFSVTNFGRVMAQPAKKMTALTGKDEKSKDELLLQKQIAMRKNHIMRSFNNRRSGSILISSLVGKSESKLADSVHFKQNTQR